MDWDNAADAVFKAGTYGYQMIGMWVNDRAQAIYGLEAGRRLLDHPVPGHGRRP